MRMVNKWWTLSCAGSSTAVSATTWSLPSRRVSGGRMTVSRTSTRVSSTGSRSTFSRTRRSPSSRKPLRWVSEWVKECERGSSLLLCWGSLILTDRDCEVVLSRVVVLGGCPNVWTRRPITQPRPPLTPLSPFVVNVRARFSATKKASHAPTISPSVYVAYWV